MKFTNKIWICIIMSTTCNGLFGQGDTLLNSSSEGEIYLLNYTPPAKNDGAVIKRITLKYNFGISKDNPIQKFNFSWSIADFVFIDGKMYNRSDFSETIYNNITIKNIEFFAKVYSNQKYVADIVIKYPNIIPKSGGQSGWYIVGGPDWNEQFENTPPDVTREIFKNTFELKDAVIFNIEFGGIDDAKKYLKEKKEKEEKEVKEVKKRTESNTISKGKKKEVKKFRDTKFWRALMDHETQKKGKTNGFPWYIGFHPGISYVSFPIIVNSVSEITYNNVLTRNLISYTELGGGYCVNGNVEGWPIFGNYVGLGSNFSYTIGGIIERYTLNQYDVGISSHFGDRDFKLLVNYALSFRQGVFKENYTSSLPNAVTKNTVDGNIRYNARQFGLGTRIWVGKRQLHNLDFMLLIQELHLLHGDNWAVVWRMKFWKPRKFLCSIEFSTRYPAAGQIQNKLSEEDNNERLYLMLNVSKPFDFVARPSILTRHTKSKWK